MAEFPYMPLWTDAYLADTRHLSTQEHGAYLLLMMEAWRRPNCSLPDDDRFLARLTAMTPDEWATVKPTIMAFWTLDGRSKEWTQKRLKKERLKSTDRSRVARDNAARRWKKTENNDATALPLQCPEDAIQNHTKREEKEIPDGISKKKVSRGSRMTADWRLPKPWGVWAMENGLSEFEVRRTADEFRDYWLGVSGKSGVKLDWEATWRNRVRQVLDRRKPRFQAAGDYGDDAWLGGGR